jgi:hypothetical protein
LAALALLSPNAKLYSLVPLSSACPSIVTLSFLFFLKNVACFLKVALEAVVRDDLLVAKNTLSGTPEAKNLTVSVPV